MRLRPTHASGGGSRRLVPFAASVALALPGALVTSAADARPVPSGASRTADIVLLARAHRVLSVEGEPLAGRRTISPRRPITGVRTALPVIGRSVAPDGRPLLHVLLPGRPNGSRGWIEQGGTTVARTSWRIEVRTAGRRVLVYHRGRLVRSFVAIVGKPSTPTPHGLFFVEESVRMPASGPGAPYALALSAHSDVLQEFVGGPGQVAIHGLAHLTGELGTASSHGCIRLGDQSIRWLAAHIAPGVPVRITR
jgi:lipoprotein-anchoring transpeptidase ErfK/SrfK